MEKPPKWRVRFFIDSFCRGVHWTPAGEHCSPLRSVKKPYKLRIISVPLRSQQQQQRAYLACGGLRQSDPSSLRFRGFRHSFGVKGFSPKALPHKPFWYYPFFIACFYLIALLIPQNGAFSNSDGGVSMLNLGVSSSSSVWYRANTGRKS